MTSSGYISSYISASGGDFGSSRCPWKLHVPEGRRLRCTIEIYIAPSSAAHDATSGLQLHRGGAGGVGASGGGGSSSASVGLRAGCFEVALIRDGEKVTRVLSCQFPQRLQQEIHVSRGEREIFTSDTNSLVIELMLDELRKYGAGVLIKYEGKLMAMLGTR